ncbi:hypothetical protein G6F56_005942 [Rhizopus delemar]|nr:hypothetical protein G6F56_005942 [Rhizopus delemar]
MSVTYQSPTQCWSSENEYNIISYSTSDNESPSIKHHPPPEEFINALQARKHNLNSTSTRRQHPHKDALEPIHSHDLNKLMNFTTTLLIDIRSAYNYSDHHIKTAIHLAIPSILLKRSSFTLDKVAQSLTNPNDAQRFNEWSKLTHIIFYDHSSNSSNDSGNFATAVLMALKFRHVNYQGHLGYLKDGFDQFKHLFPDQCDGTDRKPIANDSSFFFSNIRQNLELSQESIKERFFIRMPQGKQHQNGVIQVSSSPTHHPRYGLGGSSLDLHGNFELPVWLKNIMNNTGPRQLADDYEHLERLEQKRLSFTMEYHASHKSIPFPFSIISSIEKGTLNRYNNIWPYEYSRVKLLDKKDDYINANYIQYAAAKDDAALRPLPPLSTIEQQLIQSGLLSQVSIETMRHPDTVDKTRRYIATQGPLPSTFNDFWKMIWNENSHVITMLTNEEELDKIKCHRYWPTDVQNYGPITVRLLSEQTFVNDKDSIIVRKFQLKHRSSLFPDRTITHLQYTGWSDFGVPDRPIGLLKLIYMVDEAYRKDHQSKGPVTVHCSAGCGRTGVFCVVDTTIQRLWHEQDVYTNSATDKVNEIIHRFREQRISMVQTHRQYVFCYEAILWWLIGYGRLPVTPISFIY